MGTPVGGLNVGYTKWPMMVLEYHWGPRLVALMLDTPNGPYKVMTFAGMVNIADNAC